MKKFVLLIVFVTLLISQAACTGSEAVTPIPPPTGEAPVKCVAPESDNDKDWHFTACVPVSTQVFTLKVKLFEEVESTTTVNASGSSSAVILDGTGAASSSYRMWTEGKGTLPVQIITISPDFEGLAVGDYIILKTSDLNVKSLPDGSIAEFICNQDVEVLSPVEDNQILTSDRMTFELDNCRLKTIEFIPSHEQGE